MKTTTDSTDLPNLEQVIAAARGIPAAALKLPEENTALNPALRFQRMAQLVRFWHQSAQRESTQVSKDS